MSSARLFIALPLGAEARSAAEANAVKWRQELRFERWVHPLDWHITLKFLGDTPLHRIEPIAASLQETAAGFPCLKLITGEPRTFGRRDTPGVFWLGVEGDTERLAALRTEIEERMTVFGFEKEDRPFHPHITLARRWRGPEPFERTLLQRHAFPSAAWNAGELVLYRTHLGKTPMYEAVRRFSFARTGEE